MKVLMLGWELPPHNSGGLGVACYQLCKSLASQNVDIEFIVPYTAKHNIDFMTINAAHPQDVEAVLKAGIAYDSFKYVSSNGLTDDVDLFGQTIIYEQAVSRIASKAEFDIIHAHDWLTCRAALRAREVSGKPMIVHLHSIESDRAGKEFGGNQLVREIEELATHLADKVIAVSERTKSGIVREYGIPADKIEVVHNSIDTTDLLPLGAENVYRYLELMKSRGHKVVISVGRLTIQKGLPNLMRAAQKVVEHNPDTLFLIVGSGEQEYELIELAADLGIGANVIFTGFLAGKQWRDSFGIGDLLVLPSISEPFGITPLESIGYGTPALISKQSGVSEVLMNCLKVDYWDIDEMANQITSSLQNDAVLKDLLSNSQAELAKMTWGEPSGKIKAIYDAEMEMA